jgi:hypothetical protein
MSDHRLEHSGVTLAALALIVSASAWLYLYAERPAGPSRTGIPTAPESQQWLPALEQPRGLPVRRENRPADAGSAKHPLKPVDYGGNWGIVSPDLVESGMVSAREAKILNEASIRFAGSAVQAGSVRTAE